MKALGTDASVMSYK